MLTQILLGVVLIGAGGLIGGLLVYRGRWVLGVLVSIGCSLAWVAVVFQIEGWWSR